MIPPSDIVGRKMPGIQINVSNKLHPFTASQIPGLKETAQKLPDSLTFGPVDASPLQGRE